MCPRGCILSRLRATKQNNLLFFQVSTRVASWRSYERHATVVSRPRLRGRGLWLCQGPLTVSEPLSGLCNPSMGAGCEFWHLVTLRGSSCASAGERPVQTHAWQHRLGQAGSPGHSCPGSRTALIRASRPGHREKMCLDPALYSVDGAARCTRDPSVLQVFPTLRPHAARVWLCAPVCHLW